MKWLIIQSDGEHKGQDGWCPNWHFRECYAIQHALQHNGQEADIWGLRHASYGWPADFESYDVLFVVENYEMVWLPDLKTIQRPIKVQWIIDAHWQDHSVYDPIVEGCDVILHSTSRYISDYSKRHPGKKHLWFPNGVDDRFFDAQLYPKQARSSDLIFIGGDAGNRKYAINWMIGNARMNYRYGVTGMDYVNAILNAKIQWNMGINGDINYRNFETIGLGCCLLTEFNPELEKLGFVHGCNCLFYSTLAEAKMLATKKLYNRKWEEIAEAGYQLSKQNTYTQRIKKLLCQMH